MRERNEAVAFPDLNYTYGFYIVCCYQSSCPTAAEGERKIHGKEGIQWTNNGTTYIDILDEWNLPHTFSPTFETTMNDAIQTLKKTPSKSKKPRFRKIIIIAIIITIMATMVLSVGALRSAIYNFITEVFPTHTEVEIESDHIASITPNDIYRVDPIPEGFQMSYHSSWDPNIDFISSIYGHNESYVIFTQYLQSAYTPNINTEGTEIIPTDVRGYHGFSVSLNENTYLAWEESGYVFSLSGNVTKDILIQFANNVIS